MPSIGRHRPEPASTSSHPPLPCGRQLSSSSLARVLLPPLLVLRAKLARRIARGEVVVLENLPDLQLRALGERRARGPLDRLRLGADLDDREARDHLLALGERPVDHHRTLPAAEA